MKAPLSLTLLPLFGLALSTGLSAKDTRPNILWITIEDWGPELSCYGTKGIHTPHVKSLLGEAVKQRRYIFAARDKMDETHDAMRAIRSRDFKLILNLMPE
jgi:hypothetical protein